MKKLLSITAAAVLALAAGVASAEPYEGFPTLNDRDFCKDMNAWMKLYEGYGYSEDFLENWVKTRRFRWIAQPTTNHTRTRNQQSGRE